MAEQTLSTLLPILWSARMDAACDSWHLNERAAPPLKALAGDTGDARLRQAADHTVAASEHFDAAVKALRAAVSLIETCTPNQEPS